MPLIERSLLPNSFIHLSLTPYHRGSYKLRKLSNSPQAIEPENTHLRLSYLSKLSSKISNDTMMETKLKLWVLLLSAHLS